MVRSKASCNVVDGQSMPLTCSNANDIQKYKYHATSLLAAKWGDDCHKLQPLHRITEEIMIYNLRASHDKSSKGVITDGRH